MHKPASSKDKKSPSLALKDMLAIGFDWDGTLVDSMSVKSEAFADATSRYYPDLAVHHDTIRQLYLASRGNPRSHQLKLVQEQFKLRDLSSEETQKWSDLFTSLYIDKKLPLFPDTVFTLINLRRQGLKLFLCSSVPQADLDRTLASYSVREYFEMTLGTQEEGFRKGLPHLSYVSEKLGIPPGKIAFCGDGTDDVSGANDAGCFSIGKANPGVNGALDEIKRGNPDLIICELKQLIETVQ